MNYTSIYPKLTVILSIILSMYIQEGEDSLCKKGEIGYCIEQLDGTGRCINLLVEGAPMCSPTIITE